MNKKQKATEENMLHEWIIDQKINKQLGRLPKEQIAKMEAINGFEWNLTLEECKTILLWILRLYCFEEVSESNIRKGKFKWLYAIITTHYKLTWDEFLQICNGHTVDLGETF